MVDFHDDHFTQSKSSCVHFSAVGQTLRATPLKDFYAKNARFFKRLQEVSLAVSLWVIRRQHYDRSALFSWFSLG